MVATTVKTPIRQVYQYLNDGKELYIRALVFGVRYPGLIFGDILAATLENSSLHAGIRSEDADGFITDHTHVGHNLI